MIRAYTIFDIRNKNVTEAATKFSRKNWNTIMQIASMRCQIDIITEGSIWTGEPITGFADKYSDFAHVFYFEFDSHVPQVYKSLTDPLHYLKEDSNNVPMLIIDAENNTYEVELVNTDPAHANIIYKII